MKRSFERIQTIFNSYQLSPIKDGTDLYLNPLHKNMFWLKSDKCFRSWIWKCEKFMTTPMRSTTNNMQIFIGKGNLSLSSSELKITDLNVPTNYSNWIYLRSMFNVSYSLMTSRACLINVINVGRQTIVMQCEQCRKKTYLLQKP